MLLDWHRDEITLEGEIKSASEPRTDWRIRPQTRPAHAKCLPRL